MYLRILSFSELRRSRTTLRLEVRRGAWDPSRLRNLITCSRFPRGKRTPDDRKKMLAAPDRSAGKIIDNKEIDGRL